MGTKKTVTMHKGGQDGPSIEVMPGSVDLWTRKGYKLYKKDANEAGVEQIEGADGQVATTVSTALTRPDTGSSKTTDKKE